MPAFSIFSKSVLLFVLFLLSICKPAGADIIFVDDSAPGGDGTTWPQAYNDLQDAFDDAAQNTTADIIFVAQGTYKPGTLRTDTFELQADLELRGGYIGYNAPDPTIRDPVLYPSILSGDLSGNDGPALFQDNGDNSYHIITALLIGDTAVVDGFTIRGGNANGTSQRTGAAVILSAPSDAIDGPPPDFDSSGNVGPEDLATLLASWGACP